MVRAQSQGESRNLGNALFQILKEKKAVVIASTDLSHFYPLDQAKLFDNAMLHAIAKLDTAAMFRLEERGEGFACGLGAVAAVIEYAKLAGASRGVILKHATSAEVTGDPTSVVGYGSVALVK
jgi:AmmeMemoRadiSam system protein B